MRTKAALEKIFREIKIEYYSTLAYSDLKEVRGHIIKKCGIKPESVIIFLLPYYSGRALNISKYAAAKDYHIAIRMITDRIIAVLSELFPESRSFGFGDHSPIDERDAALKASLGILGDNGLLINEKYGSYVFIGEVITDIPPEALGTISPAAQLKCKSCGSCKKACPTGILRGEGCDCLSAITQRKGTLSDGEAELIKASNMVWGCDICQDACPYNQNPETTPIDFFRENRIEELRADIINSMNDDEFSERAFSWRGREVLIRNLELFGK